MRFFKLKRFCKANKRVSGSKLRREGLEYIKFKSGLILSIADNITYPVHDIRGVG